jgi:transposase
MCFSTASRRISSAEMFLAEFAKAYAPAGKQIILVWDGAPAHVAKSVRVPERIRLVSLPPYTPELKPAEHWWPLVKEAAANDCFKELSALERHVCRRVKRLAEDRELISSHLCYHW